MLRSLLILLLGCLSLFAQDGPYVQWQGKAAQVFSIEDGKLQVRSARAPFDLKVPGEKTLRLTGRPYAPDPAVFPPSGQIVAVSDIHGHFDELISLLKMHGVVDEHLHWSFGQGHFVIVGDVVDRGLQVTEALWFIRGLEEEAKRAGGRVHLLLGNHENMVAAGDLRYTSPIYTYPPEGMPTLVERFGPDSELGRWLRSKPTLLKIGPLLFVHGGISPELRARRFTLARVNSMVRTHLGELRDERDEAVSFLLGPEGPLWFRGLILGEEEEATDAQVAQLLAYFKVKALVVGHTTEPQIQALHADQVFAIDAGLKEGQGELWIWDHGKAFRGLKDGQRIPL